MKRVNITTLVTCLVLLGIFVGAFKLMNPSVARDDLKIGFIYSI